MQHYYKGISVPLLKKLDSNYHQKQSIHIEELYEDIRQNLEKLLNTRRRFSHYPAILNELRQSLLCYGIMPFHHYTSIQLQQELCEVLKEAILRFEPRIKHPKVSIIEDEKLDRILKLHIEANINVSKSIAKTIFESSLDLKNYYFEFER